MTYRFLLYVSAAILGLALHSVQAAIVVSNLDPANADFGFNAPTIGQSILTGNRPIALSSVSFFQATQAAGETFSVYSRNADGSVGASLFSAFTFAFDSTMSTTTATVSGAFTLQAFTGYYFVVSSGTTSNIEWSYTSSTDYAAAFGVTLPTTRTSFDTVGTSTIYYNLSDGPQELQVNGTALAAVPEPSVWVWLALAGAASLLACRRARVSAQAGQTAGGSV